MSEATQHLRDKARAEAEEQRREIRCQQYRELNTIDNRWGPLADAAEQKLLKAEAVFGRISRLWDEDRRVSFNRAHAAELALASRLARKLKDFQEHGRAKTPSEYGEDEKQTEATLARLKANDPPPPPRPSWIV
jgi:hypothetical protein